MGANRRSVPKRVPIDLTVVLSIPAILMGIHATTTETARIQLSFSLANPSVHTAWTAAAVHRSWAHLEANILAYLLATLAAYAIYVKMRRESLMLGLVAVVLVTTPPVQSLIDYLVLNVHLDAVSPESQTRGFSGVVGGFTGMLIASIGAYITHRTNAAVGNNALLIMFFLSSGVLFAVYTPTGFVLGSTIALLLIGIALSMYRIITQLDVRNLTDVRNRANTAYWEVVLVYTTTVVALFLVYMSFPSDPGAGETTANIIAHLTGIVYGFIATSLILRLA